MLIRDCVYVSHGDAVGKARHLNSLFIQEEREYRAHLLLDQRGTFRVNRVKHRFDSGFFTLTLPGDHYTVTLDQPQSSLGYYVAIFELDDDDTKLASYILSNLAEEAFRLKPTSRFTFDELIVQQQSTNPFQKQSARHILLSLLYGLSKEEPFTANHKEGREAADKAVRIMHERKFGTIRLDDLSSVLNLSVPHFIRIFKSQMGLPPMKFFTRIKVEEAATQLMNSDKPLSAVAEDLNFSSPAHFSKTFKQYMGLCPTQYRNNYINTLESRQEQSMKEIEKAHVLLQNIIDESPDLVFYKDINGIMMGCNRAVCEILGLEKNQIVGRSDYELFSRERAEFFVRRDDIIFRTNRSCKNEEWMTYPDGRRRKFEVYKAPFHDSEGRILGLIGISRDITERDELSARRNSV